MVTVGGFTWMEWANILVLQFFGLRLAARYDNAGRHVGYTVRVRWPLTGWYGFGQAYTVVWLLYVAAALSWLVLG